MRKYVQPRTEIISVQTQTSVLVVSKMLVSDGDSQTKAW